MEMVNLERFGIQINHIQDLLHGDVMTAYRDCKVDNLVAIDYDVQQEIYKSGYGYILMIVTLIRLGNIRRV